MNTERTMGDILNRLESEGFPLPEGGLTSAGEAMQEEKAAKQPWYVRLFTGVSAWIAAILFIGFLFGANILEGEIGALISGIVFIGIAIGVNLLELRNDFVGQVGLALSLAGQALFIYGIVALFDDSLLVPLLIIAVEIGLIIAYQDRFHRFLSAVIIVATLLYVIFDQDAYELIHVLILGLTLSVTFLILRERHFQISGHEDIFQPVGIGISVSFLSMLLLPIGGDLFIRSWWITAVLQLGVFIYVILEIAAELQVPWKTGAVPWLLFGAVILTFPALRMPGILGAALLLVLGFWRSNRLLIGIASVFLLFYLGAFYYTLAWTLLQKSVALMGTGVFLLLLRYATLHFGGEEAS
jgi:hypothetical protein